jgi:DNA-binding transcriptional MerR regulator
MAHPPSLASLSTAPIFNTKAVAHETGVPPDTFRAWERRYGVPRPQRTAGGHRLYSEQDIAIIRWLRDRTAEGVNISHAVMLLTTVTEGPPASSGEAFSIYPFDDVLLDVVQPAMVEVGERWHRGEINVAAEHFATEFVRRKLASLLNVFDNNPGRETIVVGCAPHELHDIGALLASLFLLRRGWHVMYLGAQVPLADLLETVERVKPVLVCLSAATMETAEQLQGVAQALAQRAPNVHFGYGGRIFNHSPELCTTTPGMFLGQDARVLVENVASLLKGRTPL